MDHINHLSLKDRTLWFDGSTTVSSDEIEKYIEHVQSGKLFVDDLTQDILDFNKLSNDKIKVKTELDELSTEWSLLPLDILEINVRDYLDIQLAVEFEENDFTDEEMNERIDRVCFEYEILENEELIQVLYAILHIINTFEENNIVWGVGRGSSTSSYILYLLGAHDVDSVKYDLDFSEFIH